MDALAAAVRAVTVSFNAKLDWKKLSADVQSLVDGGADPIEAVSSLPIGKYIDIDFENEGKGDGGREQITTAGVA
jgi:hypothetical protein